MTRRAIDVPIRAAGALRAPAVLLALAVLVGPATPLHAHGPVRRVPQTNGPVKLFYVGALENYREGTPNPLSVSWPELEMRGGDFSKLTNAQGQPVIIYDPLNSTSPVSPFHNSRCIETVKLS